MEKKWGTVSMELLFSFWNWNLDSYWPMTATLGSEECLLLQRQSFNSLCKKPTKDSAGKFTDASLRDLQDSLVFRLQRDLMSLHGFLFINWNFVSHGLVLPCHLCSAFLFIYGTSYIYMERVVDCRDRTSSSQRPDVMFFLPICKPPRYISVFPM